MTKFKVGDRIRFKSDPVSKTLLIVEIDVEQRDDFIYRVQEGVLGFLVREGDVELIDERPSVVRDSLRKDLLSD